MQLYSQNKGSASQLPSMYVTFDTPQAIKYLKTTQRNEKKYGVVKSSKKNLKFATSTYFLISANILLIGYQSTFLHTSLLYQSLASFLDLHSFHSKLFESLSD